MKSKRTRAFILSWTALTFLLLIALPAIFEGMFPSGVTMRGDKASAFILYTLAGVLLIVGVDNFRRQPRVVAILVVSVMVSLGVADRILSYLLPSLALPGLIPLTSPVYHHRYPPHALMFQRYTEKGHSRTVSIETNEDGLRSPHSRESFRAHTTRIAVLGDSFVFGTLVGGGETFSAVWERKLRAQGIDGAVLNAGVISYSPFLQDRQYRDVVSHYRPTHVLLLLDETDIGDDYHYRSLAEMGQPAGTFPLLEESVSLLGSPLYTLIRPSLLFPLNELRRIRFPESNYYNFSVVIGGVEERNRFFIYRHPLELTRPYFEYTFRMIGELAGAVSAETRFTVVLAPRFLHWNTAACPNNWEKDLYGVNEPFKGEYLRFFEEKASGPIRMVNLLPFFRARPDASLVFDNDPHWTVEGHEFVADSLLSMWNEAQLFASSESRKGAMDPRS